MRTFTFTCLYEWGGKMETNMRWIGGRNMGLQGFSSYSLYVNIFLNIITSRLFEMINRVVKNYHCKRKSLATFCKDIHITRYSVFWRCMRFPRSLSKMDLWKVEGYPHKPTPFGSGITMKLLIIPFQSFLRITPSIFLKFVEKNF